MNFQMPKLKLYSKNSLVTINPINPIARVMALARRKYATQVVKPKKGKGSYERNKEKRNAIKRHKEES